MTESIDRRDFLKCATASMATAVLTSKTATAQAAENKLRLRIALKLSMVSGNDSLVDKFKRANAASFEGVRYHEPTVGTIVPRRRLMFRALSFMEWSTMSTGVRHCRIPIQFQWCVLK